MLHEREATIIVHRAFFGAAFSRDLTPGIGLKRRLPARRDATPEIPSNGGARPAGIGGTVDEAVARQLSADMPTERQLHASPSRARDCHVGAVVPHHVTRGTAGDWPARRHRRVTPAPALRVLPRSTGYDFQSAALSVSFGRLYLKR